ncbi:MAG: hypothetical protein P4L31_05560 [Candidatus Babeliales bacterium]|nr:hypothetical protein [Candidatus Babeliales bacterium]
MKTLNKYFTFAFALFLYSKTQASHNLALPLHPEPALLSSYQQEMPPQESLQPAGPAQQSMLEPTALSGRQRRQAQWEAEVKTKMEKEAFERNYRFKVQQQKQAAQKQQADAVRAAHSKIESDKLNAERFEYNKPENQLKRAFDFLESKVMPSNAKERFSSTMKQEFIPMYAPSPAGPAPVIMEDKDYAASEYMRHSCTFDDVHGPGSTHYDYIGADQLKVITGTTLTPQQWNAMRIKVARTYLDPKNGLFKQGLSCNDRSSDMCAFSSCYTSKCCDACIEIDEKNKCLGCIFSPCMLLWGIAACAYDATSSACQTPCATSYVCCNAECARKCYRWRYEKDVLDKLGVHKK